MPSREDLTMIISLLITLIVCLVVMGVMNDRQLKDELADAKKDMHRTCVMHQGQALIKMECTVINDKLATTY